ncbi:Pentatricopeptide repeat-containing protein [Thalictrum thalictroides]|uniref:Pentatricopeptide repeat-containing protein n=1 Tax=Thalictrum thalictroides TaxID=46969 RepID=A0A7J6VCF7_THATH|nr:Pentatricopeptide repeat-containing protein [Thalictrum thalictroides]
MGSLWHCRVELRINFVSEGCNVVSCFAHFRLQNQRNEFGYQGLGIVNLQSYRFWSSFREFQYEENHRTVSKSVLVRSIVSIIQKTDKWDTLLSRLCVVSSSKITPPIAVQVIKRIKKPDIALKFFEWLRGCNGFKHDSLTYSAILKVLTKDSSPAHATVADGLLQKKIDLGFEVSPTDYEFVLQQWVKVGKPEKALGLLDGMKSYGFVPSCLSCNIMLQGLFKAKRTDLGLELFHQMQDGWIDALDTQTFNIVMKVACIGRRMEEALRHFNTMKQRDCMPDLDSFNILIKGFSEKGETEMICCVFKQMLDLNVKPDSYTLNLLIKELCKQGRPERGNDLFYHMRRVGWIDKKFVYTQLVDSLCNYGWWLKALKIFVKMIRRGHHPKVSLYSNLVRRLCTGGRIRQAFKLKDFIVKKGFISDIEIYNALMEGVCLAGRMDMAEKLLHEYQHKRLDPDVRMWNALLRGHCMQKNVSKALGIVQKIKEIGMVPDLDPCNNLITNLIAEKKIEEAMQVKSCIQVYQNTCYETGPALSIEVNNLADSGVDRSG